MLIAVLNRYQQLPANNESKVYLILDNWNDFNFRTACNVIYVDENGNRKNLTSVKIGRVGQQKGLHSLTAGDIFLNVLPDDYFSLGDNEYYEKLNNLGPSIRDKLLKALNDIAKYPEIYESVKEEPVTQSSLMRGFSETELTGQLRRMANGGSHLIHYNFRFDSPVLPGTNCAYSLTFTVNPESQPPTNVNVLIGRNAVGKTSIFHSMISSFIIDDGIEKNKGRFTSDEFLESGYVFANLTLVSFSAFDEVGALSELHKSKMAIPYTYIGLKKLINTHEAQIALKTPNETSKEFVSSLSTCRQKLKHDDWLKAIKILESDPNFKEESFEKLATIDDEEFETKAFEQFKRLSSGHKIVLLSVTRLVEVLEEKTLVLIDEPETHLHPPLLSAFMTCVSKLVGNKNGVAIIATHSPVVLQEVPRCCVWKLRRTGSEAIAERLEIESYGENVGVLTSQVFGLEVTSSGFHKTLKELLTEPGIDTYEVAVELLRDQLGLEGKAILRSLIAQKIKRNESNR